MLERLYIFKISLPKPLSAKWPLALLSFIIFSFPMSPMAASSQATSVSSRAKLIELSLNEFETHAAVTNDAVQQENTYVPVGNSNSDFSKSDSPSRATHYDNLHSNVKNPTEANPQHTIELATGLMGYEYKEPGIMNQDGLLGVISGVFTLRTATNQGIHSVRDIFSNKNTLNVFRVEGMYGAGNLNFEGDGMGNRSDRRNYLFDIQAKAGYDIPFLANSLITPYAGFGFRYLYDDSPGRILSIVNLTGPTDYKRESKYLYMPFGIETQTAFTNNWTIGLNAEFDLLLEGWQTEHYNDMGIVTRDMDGAVWDQDDQTYKQKSGYGVRGGIKLTKKSKDLNFFVEPNVQYWKIDDSESRQYTSQSGHAHWFWEPSHVPIMGSQPKNETISYGVKLGMLY